MREREREREEVKSDADRESLYPYFGHTHPLDIERMHLNGRGGVEKGTGVRLWYKGKQRERGSVIKRLPLRLASRT